MTFKIFYEKKQPIHQPFSSDTKFTCIFPFFYGKSFYTNLNYKQKVYIKLIK